MLTPPRRGTKEQAAERRALYQQLGAVAQSELTLRSTNAARFVHFLPFGRCSWLFILKIAAPENCGT
jgi:hypothetical protein